MFGEGISKIGEIIDYGVKLDIIDKAGAWFSYKSTKIGQGRENSKIFLKDNPALCQEIENEIRNNIGLGGELPSLSDETNIGDEEQ
jgi:recombination protein RecA